MMSASADVPAFAPRWHRRWNFVLDIALTIWVLRAPIAALAVGYLILWVTPQGQDLFVDLAMGGVVAWIRFFAVLLFVWAAPTEYASHILLTTDQSFCRPIGEKHDRLRAWLKDWAPKFLGLLVLVCALGGVIRSSLNVPSLPADAVYRAYINIFLGHRIAEFALVLAGFSVAFWCYTLAREDIAKTKIIHSAERAAAAILGPIRRRLPPIFAGYRDGAGHSEIDSDLGPLLLFLMFVLFAALPTIFPLAFSAWLPRADAVPFVLGGWIPLLAVLSGLARRLHAPLLLAVLVARALLPSMLSPGYEIDVIDPVASVMALTGKVSAGAAAFGAISLNDAVKWWEAANCGKDGRCPRPIIVAAAGGASRAGFFTASVIGQLLDDDLTGGALHGHGLPPPQLTDRLFAFSSVSGSSIATVMSVAAMAASRDGLPPCRDRSPGYWLPNPNLRSWRECLETLVAGDFLTPTFVGLAYHDTMRFLHMRGRGWLMEQSWQNQFGAVLGGKRAWTTDSLACVGSLACPFTTLRPTPKRWLPLLLLNGTSVATGQRIITTLLAPTYRRRPDGYCPTEPAHMECNLFLDAYRFHDLLNGGSSTAGDDGRSRERDIDLSEAALNSARFPLVSPPAQIRDAGGRVVDSIVDGGYFENFGVQTATELAQAIMAIDPRLDPFVLVLSNDPEAVQQGIEARQRRIRGHRSSFLPDLTAPIAAIANTRDARGALALDETGALLYRRGVNSRHVAQIRVWGESAGRSGQRDISMSWWLSKPLQLELHEQTEFDGQGHPINPSAGLNCQAIHVLLTALKAPTSHDQAPDQQPCPSGEDLQSAPPASSP